MCPDSVQTIMDPSNPRATSLTELNFFLKAQTLCGLNTAGFVFRFSSTEPISACEEADWDEGGAEKVNTSPLEDKAAIVSSQLVIFEICEPLKDCGGRYGWIPLGKYAFV